MPEHHLRRHKGIITCIGVIEPLRMVTGSEDGSLCIWHVGYGKCEHHLEGHTERVRCLAVWGWQWPVAATTTR